MESTNPVDLLVTSYSKMRLKAGEQEEVKVGDEVLEGVDTGGKPSLVGKLLTSRSYSKSSLFSHLKSVWDTEGWVRFRETWDDAFLVQFEKPEDRDKVMAEGPWLFSRKILLLQEAEGTLSRLDFLFEKVHLWVHLFGLPPLGYTVAMGRKVGARLGKVVDVDPTRRSSWKGGMKGVNYMRVRVLYEVSQPLLRGVHLAVGEENKRWITFKYERLPNFCYRCGCIGHVMKECLNATESANNDVQYGEWLRSYSDERSPFEMGSSRRKKKGDDQQKPMEADRHGGSTEMAESVADERTEAPNVSSPMIRGGNAGIDINLNVRGIQLDWAFKEWLTNSIFAGTNSGANQFWIPQNAETETLVQSEQDPHNAIISPVMHESHEDEAKDFDSNQITTPGCADVDPHASCVANPNGPSEVICNKGPARACVRSGLDSSDLHAPIAALKNRRRKSVTMVRDKSEFSTTEKAFCYGKRKAELSSVEIIDMGNNIPEVRAGLGASKRQRSRVCLQEIDTNSGLIKLRGSAEGGKDIHSRRLL